MRNIQYTAREKDPNLIKDLMEKYKNNTYVMYVEYPHKSFWSKEFKDPDFRAAIKNLFSQDKNVPLLMYVHIPFCPRQCFFCSCYSIVTKDYGMVKRYLPYLYREIDLFRDLFAENKVDPNFQEIHIGGGSPTYLSETDFDQLLEKLQLLCDIKQVKEFTMEIDPRDVTKERLKYYAQKGINRISIGVQDFDLDVQKAVNRIQPPELTEALLVPEIRKNFSNGFNFDILCGLPRQNRESFRKTIDTVIRLSPDRVCIIYLTYVPEVRKHQLFMNVSEFPSLYERAMFFRDATKQLIDSGYVRIGFDHFAKPTDILAKAMANKMVHWNALGYRPGKFLDIIGIGASSACRLTERYYVQNFYELPPYEAALDNGKFPIYRGYTLNDDNIIRRDIIHKLRSFFFLDCREIEKQFNINFKEYFQEEQIELANFAKEGIVELNNETITITEIGKHFTFLVCRIFDKFNPIKKSD